MGQRVLALALWLGAAAGAFFAESCSLLLDFDDPPFPPIADTACQAAEPNQSLEGAVQIASGAFDLAVCPAGDHDFFRFNVGSTQAVSIGVRFDPSLQTGLPALRLLRASDGELLDSGTLSPEGNLCSITRRGAIGNPLPPDNYVIEVAGESDAVALSYTLDLQVVPGP